MLPPKAEASSVRRPVRIPCTVYMLYVLTVLRTVIESGCGRVDGRRCRDSSYSTTDKHTLQLGVFTVQSYRVSIVNKQRVRPEQICEGRSR